MTTEWSVVRDAAHHEDRLRLEALGRLARHCQPALEDMRKAGAMDRAVETFQALKRAVEEAHQASANSGGCVRAAFDATPRQSSTWLARRDIESLTLHGLRHLVGAADIA